MDLLLPLLLMGGFGLFAWRFFAGRAGLPDIDPAPDRPVSFGYKITWLALPTDDVDAACAGLGRADHRFRGRDFAPCGWHSGLARIQANFNNREVFLSPPVDGWVLVVNWMPADETDAGAFQTTLTALSEEFGRAAAFGSHRTVSLASWALAEGGELIRAFTEADGTTYIDFGERTPEEDDLRLLSWEEVNEMRDGDEDEDALFDRLADEDTVVQLARAWTVDPTTLGERTGSGVGRLVRPAR